MHLTLADRIQARTRQLGLSAAQVAAIAGVNRSFVYDILRGRSEKPNLARLDQLARALKVERNWLLHGLGEVEGERPIVENPDDVFVAIPYVNVRPSMGGGNIADDEPTYGRPYHFQKSWLHHDLKADPRNLCIMRVEGDSMSPTLLDGDTVLVDMSKRAPTPPGIFVLHDGLGLVAKRLERSLGSGDTIRYRIVSDNERYTPYEVTEDEIQIIGRVRWFSREI